MTDLKSDLASLRIDRKRPGPGAWRWPLLLLVPAVLFLAVLYFLKARQTLGAPEVETVRAEILQGSNAPSGTPILTASGYVVARRKAVVSAKIQGRLAELKVEEASRVRQGEVIARLESADYEAQVKRAEAAVQRAEADLGENQRQLRVAQNLAKDQLLAVDQLEAALSRVRIAEAGLKQAQAEQTFAEASLENTYIKAPFSGTVVKKMAEVGESVAPIPPGVNLSTSSGAIVALADLDTLEVEVDVSESNVAKLGVDQPADVTVEAIPDKRYRAVLRQVIPTADRTKATVQVKVTILEKDKDLKPEMSAKVTFLEREGRSTPAALSIVAIPKDAVATRDGQNIVFEVREGKAWRRNVVLGGERSGQVVIKSGLAGGENLVTRPPQTLTDGAPVRAKG